MEHILRCLRAMGDENRLRIVMLLMERELCVCQLMVVLGISQPLVSRHLSVLKDAGIVVLRKGGKQSYYSLSEEAKAGGKSGLMKIVRRAAEADARIMSDRQRLRKCEEFEKVTGRCDIEAFREYAQQYAISSGGAA